MAPIRPALIRQSFLIALIILLAILIFQQLTTYLSGILGAITLYVLMRGFQAKLVRRGWSPTLAALFLMFLSLIVILVPIAFMAIMLSSKISQAVASSEQVVGIVKENLALAENYMGIPVTDAIDPSQISNWLSNNLESLAGGTFNASIAVGILYFLLYYMLTNRRALKESLLEYIPLSSSNLKLIGEDAVELIKSNAIGIPLVAIFQGLVALIAFLFLDINNPFFWFTITALGSTIPFVGTALGIVPVCIILYSNGHVGQAIFMALYGLVVVGSTDNFFRLIIQKKLADLHPLVTLFGVLVGLPLFGFIGLIFGPILVSIFLIMVKIYKQEYGKNPPASDENTM
ncbi:AI-2E family transporter [Croceiramulus getboli]|nr:AI-2E family transporter [Flavobacteriaceae bacterium YJPT1-3]